MLNSMLKMLHCSIYAALLKAGDIALLNVKDINLLNDNVEGTALLNFEVIALPKCIKWCITQ